MSEVCYTCSVDLLVIITVYHNHLNLYEENRCLCFKIFGPDAQSGALKEQDREMKKNARM